MVKIWLSLLLVYLLVFTAAPVLASAQPDKQARTTGQVREKVGRLGTGERARVTVRLKNGTKLKGYIERVGENEFVLKDKDTGASLNVPYNDVVSIEENEGRSTGKKIAIWAGVGFGALLLLAAIGLAHAD